MDELGNFTFDMLAKIVDLVGFLPQVMPTEALLDIEVVCSFVPDMNLFTIFSSTHIHDHVREIASRHRRGGDLEYPTAAEMVVGLSNTPAVGLAQGLLDVSEHMNLSTMMPFMLSYYVDRLPETALTPEFLDLQKKIEILEFFGDIEKGFEIVRDSMPDVEQELFDEGAFGRVEPYSEIGRAWFNLFLDSLKDG